MSTLSEFLSLRHAAGGHPLTQAFSQRAGALLAWSGLRLGLPPSAVTLLGLLVFLTGSACFARLGPGWGPALTCLALFQLGYALDCADGQLARATHRTSAFGAWLDVACDYARCVALAFAAAAWLLRTGFVPAAALACAGLFLAGTAVHIQTAAALRARAAEDLDLPAAVTPARWAATLVLDTASVLLLLALLRQAPALLAGYLAAMGALYLATSTWLALRRLA